jgi:peptidoglycan/LPS O-acetylase OafA/YrhL
LFVAGFLLMSDHGFEDTLDRAWRWLAPVAVVLVAAQLWLWSSGTWAGWDDGSAVAALLDLLEMSITWITVLTLLSVGRRFLSFENGFLRWANEGAYPIYLLHQSVIIVVAYAVLTAAGMSALLGFVVVTTISLAVTVGLYEFLVKPWNPVRFLFGMKPLSAQSEPARASIGAPHATTHAE